MPCASVVWDDGNRSNTTINATHDTATVPTGTAHRPSVKYPGTNAFRPEVTRRKMGAAYETYNPITDALPTKHEKRCQVGTWRCMTRTDPASEDSAAAENPRRPQAAAESMTHHTALTGVCVRGLMCFHQRDPGSALSRANAKTTRDASTPWAAPVTN